MIGWEDVGAGPLVSAASAPNDITGTSHHASQLALERYSAAADWSVGLRQQMNQTLSAVTRTVLAAGWRGGQHRRLPAGRCWVGLSGRTLVSPTIKNMDHRV